MILLIDQSYKFINENLNLIIIANNINTQNSRTIIDVSGKNIEGNMNKASNGLSYGDKGYDGIKG